MRVGVIGAGPAGLAAAYELAKSGVTCEVFEASPWIGGMARSFPLWGQTVDLGPHRFFSTDPRVNRLWLEVVGSDYRMVERRTRILFRGGYYRYPLEAGNALLNMGPLQAARCVASFLGEKVAPSAPAGGVESFESWVVRRFGRRLYQMFFRSYSEKLWGIPCHELDADFAAQRIKKFSLGEAIKHALGVGGGRHKTLVDRFAYPVGRQRHGVRADGGGDPRTRGACRAGDGRCAAWPTTEASSAVCGSPTARSVPSTTSSRRCR